MSVIDELTSWIGTDGIAELIVDELEEQGVPPTLENAKTVWLDILEHGLNDAICSSVNAKFDV